MGEEQDRQPPARAGRTAEDGAQPGAVARPHLAIFDVERAVRFQRQRRRGEGDLAPAEAERDGPAAAQPLQQRAAFIGAREAPAVDRDDLVAFPQSRLRGPGLRVEPARP